MVKETDYYDRLGVPPDATQDQIKRGYRLMAMKFHPDKNSDPGAAEKFKACSEAYEILSDENKRSTYDRYGKDAFTDGGGMPDMDAEAIFNTFFGRSAFFNGPRSPGVRKTKDLVVELAVSLEELYNGCTKKKEITKQGLCTACGGNGTTSKKRFTCPDCNGKGARVMLGQFAGMITRQTVTCDSCDGEGVVIPAKDRCRTCGGQKFVEVNKVLNVEIDKGTKNGMKFTFTKESSEAPGCIPGDVIVIAKEKEHSVFRRDNNHLYMEKEVPLVNALTGFQFFVKHLDGRKILVKTGPGEIIKPEDMREIRNEGMPVFSRPYEHGNLYVTFKVKFPSQLDGRQLKALVGCLPDLIPTPEGEESKDVETIVLQQVDEHMRNESRYSGGGGGGGEAYESEEDDRENNTVPCAQQ